MASISMQGVSLTFSETRLFDEPTNHMDIDSIKRLEAARENEETRNAVFDRRLQQEERWVKVLPFIPLPHISGNQCPFPI